METKRIPLPSVLATRDATVGKDGLLTNCYVEKGPDAIRVVKRPGYTLRANIGDAACPGQGAFFFVGGPVFIVCDTLVVGLPAPTPPPPAACDPASWSLQDASDPNAWVAITFGLGLFVAVANRGVSGEDVGHLIMTSPDGFTWTERATSLTAGVADEWNDICFGGGRFVAVAENGGPGRVMFSDDAITWTYVTSAATTTTQWDAVAHGGGRFVAVGVFNGGADTMHSVDGLTWSSLDSGIEHGTNWQDICTSGALFVSVGRSDVAGTIVRYSGNGITWTGTTTGVPNNQWNSVCFGLGLFVAVASSGAGNRVMTSPDGIAWTARVSAADAPWNGVTFADGVFVAVGDSSTPIIMISFDGIVWETRNIPSAQSWEEVTFGAGNFVAVSSNRNLSTATNLQRVMVAIC